MFFKLGKQGIDDIFFVAKMVIEVAWRDIQVLCKRVCSDVGLPKLIE
jgi:hypothetical protein